MHPQIKVCGLTVPEEAAQCVKDFKPAIVYPYHYRSQGAANPQQSADEFGTLMKGTKGVEVRLRNWYEK